MTDDERAKLYEAGRAKLAEMLPTARAKATEDVDSAGHMSVQATSAFGQFALSGLTEDCFQSVMIYEDGPGRWHADIGMQSRLPGQPEILGTPTSTPLGSRAEAEDFAENMLTMLVAEAIRQQRRMAAQMKKDLAESQSFNFGEVGMVIPQRMINDVLESLLQMPDQARASVLDRVEKDLEDTIIEMAGDEILTKEAINKASPEQVHRLGMLTAILLSQDKDSYTPGVGQPRM